MSSTVGNVSGLVKDENLYEEQEVLVCQHVDTIASKGIWLLDNPLDFSLPTFLAQLVVLTFLTKIAYIILKPLSQSVAAAQVIAGILSSPSLSPMFKRLYPPAGRLILLTTSEVGYMVHLFLLGVQTDVSMLRNAGKGALLIGTMSFVLPYTCCILCSYLISNREDLKDSRLVFLYYISAVNSLSSFPVITSVLTELKILNSEIGRLASYTALINDICIFTLNIILITTEVAKFSWSSAVWCFAYFGVFFLTVFFVFRPFILWLVKRNPERPVNENNFFFIILLVLISGLFSEVHGFLAAFGPYLLGIALPDGPPLGETLVGKLETFTNEILLPVIYAVSGLRTNFFIVRPDIALVTGTVLLVGNMGKFIGTLFPAIYSGVPFWDALSLALVMSCKGIIEIATYIHFMDRGVIGKSAFNCLIVNMLVITGIAKPLVAHLYDPSKRYMTYTRRTIQHTKRESQLRVLVCLYSHENIPTILNVLEASNPTSCSPVAICVLFIKELIGRASAVLVPQNDLDKSPISGTDQIAKAFKQLEKQHSGDVVVQHFTALAPFASMHNDICTMALDKKATLLIIPFHQQWSIDGTNESSIPAMRGVNQYVLSRAPCSVGVIIDRGQIHGNFKPLLSGNTTYRVAMIFAGGPDDLEALAYSTRMAGHPHVSLSIIIVSHESSTSNKFYNLITEFCSNFNCKESITYREEVVKDGVGLTNIIRSIEDAVDLVIVGMQNEKGSPILSGLEEWGEFPELGIIGDVLATWDFRFSALVVQQQPLEPVAQRGHSKHRIKNKWVLNEVTSPLSKV